MVIGPTREFRVQQTNIRCDAHITGYLKKKKCVGIMLRENIEKVLTRN